MSRFYLSTPFCQLAIQCCEQGVQDIEFIDAIPSAIPTRGVASSRPAQQIEQHIERQIERQIQGYCHNPAYPFDIPLAIQGTRFQQCVWGVLRTIPVGQVRTYGDIARQLASSAQAVGNACRANPIPLVIPCHRVVAKSAIGGFAGDTQGWRLHIKQRLLSHEGVEI